MPGNAPSLVISFVLLPQSPKTNTAAVLLQRHVTFRSTQHVPNAVEQYTKCTIRLFLTFFNCRDVHLVYCAQHLITSSVHQLCAAYVYSTPMVLDY